MNDGVWVLSHMLLVVIVVCACLRFAVSLFFESLMLHNIIKDTR